MEHKLHHKRELKFLISFLIVFLFIFVLALINLKRGIPLFGLGLPNMLENWIILVLSILSLIKIFWNILVH
jgi:uncharacterized RDD family membrane protein YckC